MRRYSRRRWIAKRRTLFARDTHTRNDSRGLMNVHDRLSGKSVTCRKSEQSNAFKNERQKSEKPLRPRRCFLLGGHPAISKGLLANCRSTTWTLHVPTVRKDASFKLTPRADIGWFLPIYGEGGNGVSSTCGGGFNGGHAIPPVQVQLIELLPVCPGGDTTRPIPKSPTVVCSQYVKLGYEFGGALSVHYNRIEVNSIDLSTIRRDSLLEPDSGSHSYQWPVSPQTLRYDRRPFWPVFLLMARSRTDAISRNTFVTNRIFELNRLFGLIGDPSKLVRTSATSRKTPDFRIV